MQINVQDFTKKQMIRPVFRMRSKNLSYQKHFLSREPIEHKKTKIKMLTQEKQQTKYRVYSCSPSSCILVRQGFIDKFVLEMIYVEGNDFNKQKHKLTLKFKKYDILVIKEKYVLIFGSAEKYDQKGKLIFWYLDSGKYQISDFDSTFEADDIQLLFFKKTNIISIVQQFSRKQDKQDDLNATFNQQKVQRIGSIKIRITSYQLNISKSLQSASKISLKKIDEYEQGLIDKQKGSRLYFYPTYFIQVNNANKIAIITNPFFEKQVNFHIYTIRNQLRIGHIQQQMTEPTIMKFKFKHSVERALRSSVSILAEAWEIQVGVLYLKLDTINNEQQYCKEITQIEQLNYIWQYKKGVCRTPAFIKNKKVDQSMHHHIHFVNQVRPIRCNNCYNRTFNLNKHKVYQVPIYLAYFYADNREEEILIQLNIRFLKNNFTFLNGELLNFNKGMICYTGKLQEYTSHLLICQMFARIRQKNMVYSFFLDQIVKNCDDDLAYLVFMMTTNISGQNYAKQSYFDKNQYL